MNYRGCVMSHGGRVRTNNEDNAYLDGYYRSDVRIFEWYRYCEVHDSVLGAVFDGMGGERDGEIASRMAAEFMWRMKRWRFSEIVEDYTIDTNEEIALYNRAGNMGTTFVALSVENDHYRFYNLGDSRGYLYRDGLLTQMTEDHTLVRRMLKNQKITEEQAARHPARHALVQYLGMKEDGEVIRPECDLTVPPEPCRPGDLFLLCSDGLTEMLPDQKIAEILKKQIAVQDKTQLLQDEALAAGGKDNVTILLLECID